MSGDAMPNGVSGPPDARLTVAAVGRRLGVAPATLRTWDRRYGVGPTLHPAGAHRRCCRSDIARLEAMQRPLPAGADGGTERALAVAAFHGSPRDALPVLAALDPTGRLPDRTRWLAGVCLGALGRYRTGERWLAAGTGQSAPGSLALSCRASHLRQLGRHVEAEPLDRAALAVATDSESRADALIGLVADAVGRLDLPAAEHRLGTARAELAGYRGRGLGGDGAWRPAVRLAWVTAEVSLLGDDPAAAVTVSRVALERSLAAMACRHAVKSELVLGAALEAAGRARAAARVLRAAAAGADRLDLPPLGWPARTLLARIIDPRAPATAARERRQADSARSIIEDDAEGCKTR
ncbi:MAG: MerR family transcriptional regulator [Mycobacteriales bacterium]